MSYLLDALRKAERERNLGRVPELVRGTIDAGAQRSGIPGWVVAAGVGLVFINVTLLAAFWWWNANPASPPVDNAPVVEQPRPAAPAPKTKRPSSLERQNTPPTTSKIPTSEKSAPQSRPENPPPPAKTRSQTPAPAIEPAQEPIIEEVPHYRALSQSQQDAVPDLQINGHLYSSIPGRSFVLIGGRRYHQGQRLPQGPAILLIDEEGAVFLHNDQRFRLDAPR